MTTSPTLKRVVGGVIGLAIAARIVVIPSAVADPRAGVPACPDNILDAIPGTTETNEQADPTAPVGMLRSVVDPLESEFSAQQLHTYAVPYIATIVNDKPQTYGTSKKEAIDRASQHIADKAGMPRHQVRSHWLLTRCRCSRRSGRQDRKRHRTNQRRPHVRSGFDGRPRSKPKRRVSTRSKDHRHCFVGARPEGFGSLDDITANVCDPEDGHLLPHSPHDAIATVPRPTGLEDRRLRPDSSVAGVVTTLLGLDGQPLTNTVGELNTAVTSGNVLLVPQLALDLAGNISTLSGAKVAEMTIPGADVAPMATSVSQLTGAINRGDMLAVPGLLVTLTPPGDHLHFSVQGRRSSGSCSRTGLGPAPGGYRQVD